MKDLLEMLDKIAEAANGQIVEIALNDYPIEILKKLRDKYAGYYLEPERNVPYFRVHFRYKDIRVTLRGKELKQVVTFETV